MLECKIAPLRNYIIFDSFRLTLEERRVEREGVAIDLGGRALDILLILLEHPGVIVEKKDLLARVWNGVIVEDVALRVHICALRRALRDGVDGARLIINVPGRGYCFVAPVYKSTWTENIEEVQFRDFKFCKVPNDLQWIGTQEGRHARSP